MKDEGGRMKDEFIIKYIPVHPSSLIPHPSSLILINYYDKLYTKRNSSRA
ncbi:MAG: hypothetical protein HY786_03615 [Deltaproteobacteria bacterium]|nr:hypothetical protein [Deltaproteobacteria bacterium]